MMDAVIEEEDSLKVGGLENQVVNEVPIAAPWEVVSAKSYQHLGEGCPFEVGKSAGA